MRVLSLNSPVPWAFVLGACLAASCDQKGITSTCPPLPLYRSYPLGDASPPDASSADAGETSAAYAAAVDAGCATAKTEFPFDAAAGAAGEGESGGSSGRGGSAGSVGVGGRAGASNGGSAGFGGSAGDNAGAAGSD